jgi:hypothetical protein
LFADVAAVHELDKEEISLVIMPISYVLSGAIALAEIAAFLGQMFKLNK